MTELTYRDAQKSQWLSRFCLDEAEAGSGLLFGSSLTAWAARSNWENT
ncbi:hypothetical protein [Rhizobium sp. RU36D]|nr:hypothetical protein [Rhizobium sp. RU36D]SMD13685.1 hypothetical protein SAMN05880593_12522 [Rhizobium sp. RU36D]